MHVSTTGKQYPWVCVLDWQHYISLIAYQQMSLLRDSLMTAAIFGSLYWLTGLSVILYPGSLAVDPEFGEGFPQFWLFSGLMASSLVGWGFEIVRLNGSLKKRV
jgi:hypothetical protein